MPEQPQPVYTRLVTVTLAFEVTDDVTDSQISDLATRAGVQIEEPYVNSDDPFNEDYLGEKVGKLTVTRTVVPLRQERSN